MSSSGETSYVSLVGGLGNQLFQYAEARSVKPEQELVLLDQFQGRHRHTPKNLDLLDFSLNNSKLGYLSCRNDILARISHNLILRFSNAKEKRIALVRKIQTVIQSATIYLAEVFIFNNVQIQAQPSLGKFPRKKLKINKSTLQLGYFQHCAWIDQSDVVKELKGLSLKTESPKLLKFTEKYEESDFLAIHMRFGDYLNERSFGIPDKKYYRKSLAIHTRARKYDEIVLFTNDEQLAKDKISNLTDIPVSIISTESGLSASENIEVMRLAKGFIIANSTFSWWGAFLAREHNYLVTYPSPWFKGMKEPQMLFPKEWIEVEFGPNA